MFSSENAERKPHRLSRFLDTRRRETRDALLDPAFVLLACGDAASKPSIFSTKGNVEKGELFRAARLDIL